MKEVNGFIIEQNKFDGYPSEYQFIVFHPIYDGQNLVFETNELSAAVSWCEQQDFNTWTEKLI